MRAEIRPKIGLLSTGHDYYWGQFPGLKDMVMNMHGKLLSMLEQWGDIVTPELVDTEEKAHSAGALFRDKGVDLVLVFPLGYTPGMRVVPAVQGLHVPVRILNAHADRSYDYAVADTAE